MTAAAELPSPNSEARRRDYFAAHPDRVAALVAACESWRGTPFRKHSRMKGPGGGVDCEWFVPCCLVECGAIARAEFDAIDVPSYALNHAEHSTESKFELWFRRPEVRARVRRVDEDEPHLDGDLVFPRVGRCLHHIGFRIGDMIHHIARPSGYCAMPVAQLDHYISRTPGQRHLRGLHAARYRLMEPAASGL